MSRRGCARRPARPHSLPLLAILHRSPAGICLGRKGCTHKCPTSKTKHLPLVFIVFFFFFLGFWVLHWGEGSTMAKSKNHTNHNQSRKNHRNGIKRPLPMHLNKSKRGGWLPALVNARRVRKFNQKAALKARRERLAAHQAKLK
ncbi:60S ribosomal protein L29 [Trypanosoma conorhini]|uniref:60S ribosomal protein L29 n=1 Tax=Trypanosoma conorhini TaxID=83891 RepID=A0A3S5IRP4_9TRYP|nr:60S ribosomal protein L29 [Trypanosoma conorhini]RNF07993.1 60S ribosomal protein L29 [Trypanosoma conorhini]